MEVLGGAALLLLFVLSCLLLLSTGQQLHRRRGMPPGPVPLPLVGNLLQIRRRAVYQSFMQIQEKYGPVYTLHLGARPVVILCGYEAVKEALVDQAEDFGGRGKELMFDWIFQGGGLPFCNGERAKQLRSFTISTLRHFSEGRRSLEERVSEEVGFLLGALRSTQGAPFDPTLFLSRSTSNVISSIMFGHRFDYTDPEFLSMLRMTLESFRFTATSWGQFYEVFSGVLAHLPGSHQKAFRKISQMREYIAGKVKASEDTLDPSAPRGFIDCFLVKMQKEEKTPSSELSRTSLVLSVLGIFFAGTEIVSSTLRYGLLMLLKHPEIQEKLHEELDRVVGRSRPPRMEDLSQLPYTKAVLHEIQRHARMLPVGVARCVTRDTCFRGYTIPKGTDVFPMLGSVLRDPKHFARPEAFDPEHFLDEKRQFKRSEAFLPFSIGKRACLGEHLAGMELFLFLTSILQNFRLQSPVPPEDISITPLLVGFVTVTPFYKVCALPR